MIIKYAYVYQNSYKCYILRFNLFSCMVLMLDKKLWIYQNILLLTQIVYLLLSLTVFLSLFLVLNIVQIIYLNILYEIHLVKKASVLYNFFIVLYSLNNIYSYLLLKVFWFFFKCSHIFFPVEIQIGKVMSICTFFISYSNLFMIPSSYCQQISPILSSFISNSDIFISSLKALIKYD